MRKLNLFFLAMTIMLTIALPACAESAQQPGVNAFFDWSCLATYSGAVAAVVFIVQFLKLPIDRLGHVPTRVLVYVVSLAVLLLAQLFTGHLFTPEVIALAVLNAVIVAFAAMGVYERAIALPEAEKNDELVEAAQLLGSDGFGVAYAQTEESTPSEKGETEDVV